MTNNSGTEEGRTCIHILRNKSQYEQNDFSDAVEKVLSSFTRFRKLEIEIESNTKYLIAEATHYINGGTQNRYDHIPLERVLGALLTWESLISNFELPDKYNLISYINKLYELTESESLICQTGLPQSIG